MRAAISRHIETGGDRHPVAASAKFLTTVHDHLLRTGMAELADAGPLPGRLIAATTGNRNAIDTLTTTTQFAA